MNADVIKDFLISLGFQVDESGAKKFDATIANTTLQAVKLGVAVEAAALSVVAFTAKVASGLDNLYWMSQRTGATVAGIQQIGYAVSQLGGTVDGARSSLEGLASFVRNNPGAEGFLNRLGVQTRDAKGNMRDMASIFTGVGQRLSQMPYYRANQYAQMLGIDENTLMAMRRGVGQFSAQYTQMAKAIGYNADVAAVSSNHFMTSLRSFGQMAGMARDKIGSDLAGGLAGSIDSLRRQILNNFPKIEQAITTGGKAILWLGDMLGRVLYRLIQASGAVIDWWHSLDRSTQQVIASVGGLIVVWKALNTAFMTSPVGRIIALAAGIAALVEDYLTWKEGGQSLIDWSKWEPGIKYATSAISGLGKDFGGLFDKVTSLGSAVADAVTHLLELVNIDTSKFSGKWLFDQIIESVRSSIKMIGALVDALRKIIGGDFAGAWNSLKDFAKTGIESPLGQGLKAVGGAAFNAATDAAGGAYNAANGVVNGAYFQANDIVNGAYQYANHALNSLLPGWAGGSEVKQPQPTKDGAALLGWMQPAFQKLEQLYRLPEGLLRSVAITESAGNPNAISGAGAQGLFQIMPGTGRDLGLRGDDAFDPMKAAGAAAKYLSQLLKANDGDLTKTLASYNWGLSNVQKHGMALMPQETRNYVPRVMSNMPGGGNTVHQQNTYNIYGGNAREIGDQVGRSVSEKAINIGQNKAGAG
ncbi:lytic transglycosylase domain-containing protein [Pantoea vagans]|uniref:lytic transglycosylase domain-containing protein n=1 Tax=Pantoea vagans TaxID=470934 RepID=UPI0023AFC4E1|nr:lytic transglycosylase domain-containing protein [Pantoea vagans]MDE8556125.1 lytic transglycosylase domain-containing protein [Pantoea vagans]MDE8576176.1 lytic transglycosylase domain-containing protein [Pantoea vagans]